jgi:hypothetical protein
MGTNETLDTLIEAKIFTEILISKVVSKAEERTKQGKCNCHLQNGERALRTASFMFEECNDILLLTYHGQIVESIYNNIDTLLSDELSNNYH